MKKKKNPGTERQITCSLVIPKGGEEQAGGSIGRMMMGTKTAPCELRLHSAEGWLASTMIYRILHKDPEESSSTPLNTNKQSGG